MCYIQLNALFPEVKPLDRSITSKDEPSTSKMSGSITVKRFDGMTVKIKYEESMSVNEAKCAIHKEINVIVEKQCLLFNGRELKVS